MNEDTKQEENMNEYETFLESKRMADVPCGLDEVPCLNPMLFEFQKRIVDWALRRGRAAIFADCGLGKTPMQLEWARCVSDHTGNPVLIVAPLAVSKQTIREGDKFGIHVEQLDADVSGSGIYITNYEQMHKASADQFGGIVLDESSILKSFGGVFRRNLTDFAKSIPYRLACTATPAPNDLIELSNHAEFLDVMSGKEIMALFFIQDGNTTHKWKLKGHAEHDYWRWMASWSVAIRSPADLGFDSDGFNLPPLVMHEHTVDAGDPADGMLFPMEARTMDERRTARRESTTERVGTLAEIINGTAGPWLVWCNLNYESELATKAIEGAVEVKGSDSSDHKENALLDFAAGKIRCLVSKPSIAGFGMNFQVCHKVAFLGLSDSYEQFYQAIRRCWRFGQDHSVDAHIIISTMEGAVRSNIERKEQQAREMFENIVSHMKGLQLDKTGRTEMDHHKDTTNGEEWEMKLGDSCERIKEIESDTVGLTVFSPPFPGMYAYTNSPRDVGNVKNTQELIKHFGFMVSEINRVTMPGRSCCIHLTQEVIFKMQEGYSGLRDFRGDIIRLMQDHDWIYSSERTIDKDPQLKAARTKDHGLAMKTGAKDSAGWTGTMPDYLLQFKKKGDNAVPIKSLIDHQDPKKRNPEGWITREEWIQWASAVWYGHHRIETGGIRESDVLRVRGTKDEKDEKHLCPLQLGVIERCVKLWSAPGDLVFSPFAGIGSEGYTAVRFGRKFVGIELKPSYFNAACENMRYAEEMSSASDLFAKKEIAV